MPVGIKRDLHGAMPNQRLNPLRVESLLDPERRGCMAKDACSILGSLYFVRFSWLCYTSGDQDRLQVLLCHYVMREDVPLYAREGKIEPVLGARDFPTPENCYQSLWNRDRAKARRRFWSSDDTARICPLGL